MNGSFSSSFLGAVAALAVGGCGLGGTADLGDDRTNVGQGSDPDGSGGSGGSGGEAPTPPPMGVTCGSAVCDQGEVCCNASCSLCAAPDEVCTQESCEPQDCTGAAVLCIEGTAWSFATCDCAPLVDGVPCGESVCVGGDVCCNESCGTCTAPGGACTEQDCGAPPDACSSVAALCVEGYVWSPDDCTCVPGVGCGPNVCVNGDLCCNESCGICAPPGAGCTEQFCGPTESDCVTDEDCALVDDYCSGGCDCLALPDTADPPTCSDPVSCLQSPCDGKSVACVGGMCTVTP